MTDFSASASTLPLVSVVIPAYNAEAYVARTLDSVLQQTYPRLEILVVDDGSSDRTAAIVQAIVDERVTDPDHQTAPKITLLQQANAGVAMARNLGIQAAQGSLIAPVDADDLWAPDYLENLVNCLRSAPAEVGVIYTWSVDIDEDDRILSGFHAARVQGDVCRTLLCHNFLGNASSTLIRRDCLAQIGSYDPSLRAQQAQGCEDWDLYLRLAAVCEYRVVPEFLVGYRKLQRSMSGDGRQMARSQNLILAKLRQRQPEIPGWLYGISMSSFYLYLADQSDRADQSDQVWHWLKQAVSVDVTPWFRLGWYRLAGKCLRRKVLPMQPSTPDRRPVVSESRRSSQRSRTWGQSGSAQSWQNKPALVAPWKVWIKVGVSHLLHHLVSQAGKVPAGAGSRVRSLPTER